MKQTQIEIVGKVFVVVGGKRKCLICEGMFSPRQAANHAMTICFPTSMKSEQHEGENCYAGVEIADLSRPAFVRLRQ
jgi:hypothetical protein